MRVVVLNPFGLRIQKSEVRILSGMLSSHEQARQLGSVLDPRLPENIVIVILYGLGRDAKIVGDFPVRLPPADEGDDLDFPPCNAIRCQEIGRRVEYCPRFRGEGLGICPNPEEKRPAPAGGRMRRSRFHESCELRDPDLPPGKQLIADRDAAGEHN